MFVCVSPARVSDSVNHFVAGCCDAATCVELLLAFFGLDGSCWNFFDESGGFELLESGSDDVA